LLDFHADVEDLAVASEQRPSGPERHGYVDDGELADAVTLANRVLAMCWRLTHP
jgi:hypothetical protein